MNTVMLAAAAAVMVVVQASAGEAPSQAAQYISDAQLQGIEAKVGQKDGKPGSFSARMFNASTYSMAFIRLSEPDTPHAHGSWSEVFVVREGAGVLETGGTITGVTSNDSATHKSMFVDAHGNPLQPAARPAGPPRKATPGDLAGTAIEGGTRQAAKAGDVILVPAGVPHRWVQIDQPVVYLDIKFPKAQ